MNIPTTATSEAPLNAELGEEQWYTSVLDFHRTCAVDTSNLDSTHDSVVIRKQGCGVFIVSILNHLLVYVSYFLTMAVFKISSQIPENGPVGTRQPVGAGEQVPCGRASPGTQPEGWQEPSDFWKRVERGDGRDSTAEVWHGLVPRCQILTPPTTATQLSIITQCARCDFTPISAPSARDKVQSPRPGL